MAAKPQMSGILELSRLIEILRWVGEAAFTGVFAMTRGESKKSLVFERGRIIAARSNVKSESLSALLLAEGKITPKQLKESLSMIEGKEVAQQGEALVALGILDRALLQQVLHKQLLERVYELFTWKDGKYALVEQVPPDLGRTEVEETMSEIIFRGLVRRYEGSEEAKALTLAEKPSAMTESSGDVERLRLVGREQAFLHGMNGRTSLKDLIAKHRAEEPTARAMLLAFQDLSLARISGASAPPSARQAAAVASGIQAEIRKILSAKYASYYEVLGVAQKALPAEIKAVYFEIAKKYHPDRLPPQLSADDRAKMEQFFARVTEAYGVLSNDLYRREYDASLAMKAESAGAPEAKTVMEAEMEYQKGIVLVRKGDFAGAAESFQRAVDLYGEEPEFHAYLGWSLFRNSQKTKSRDGVTKGKEALQKALKMNSDLEQAIYFVASIAKAEGDLNRARTHFAKVLELNPKHLEAASEMRLLTMRDEKKQAAGLKGLFRKKE